MRFIITSQAGPGAPGADQPFSEQQLVAYMQYNEALHRAGVLVASEGLNPSAGGARIAVRDGRRYLVDGPFAESKELVGGFYLIEVPSLAEAIQWALRCPVGMASAEVLEVRPLTAAADLPPELLRIINAAAPGWSAEMFQQQRGPA